MRSGRRGRTRDLEGGDGPGLPVRRVLRVCRTGVPSCLGWPDPVNICDLFVESRICGMAWRAVAVCWMRRWRFSSLTRCPRKKRIAIASWYSGRTVVVERATTILEYCDADVRLTGELFRAMAPQIAVDHACLRGQFMAAVATIEYTVFPSIGRCLTRYVQTGTA